MDEIYIPVTAKTLKKRAYRVEINNPVDLRRKISYHQHLVPLDENGNVCGNPLYTDPIMVDIKTLMDVGDIKLSNGKTISIAEFSEANEILYLMVENYISTQKQEVLPNE